MHLILGDKESFRVNAHLTLTMDLDLMKFRSNWTLIWKNYLRTDHWLSQGGGDCVLMILCSYTPHKQPSDDQYLNLN